MDKKQFILKTIKGRLLHTFKKRTPLRVTHRITTKCNLKCSFCDHYLHEQKTNELSTPELIEIMEAFASLGTNAWGITGGEPFLRPDLPEVLACSKRLGFLTSSMTNGTVVDEGALRSSLKWMDYLVTSLEGPKDSTDGIRGAGVFDKVVKTIEIANKAGVPVIVGTVITKDLIDASGIDFMGYFCKEMGVRCSFQNLLLNGPYGGDGFHDEKDEIVAHAPSLKELKQAIDKILKMRNHGFPFVNNRAWGKYVVDYYEGNLKAPTCYAGKLYCNMFEDGTIRSCQYHPVALKGGGDLAQTLYKMPGPFKDCPCLAICYINYNLAFSFDPLMVLDGFRNVFYSRKSKN